VEKGHGSPCPYRIKIKNENPLARYKEDFLKKVGYNE